MFTSLLIIAIEHIHLAQCSSTSRILSPQYQRVSNQLIQKGLDPNIIKLDLLPRKMLTLLNSDAFKGKQFDEFNVFMKVVRRIRKDAHVRFMQETDYFDNDEEALIRSIVSISQHHKLPIPSILTIDFMMGTANNNTMDTPRSNMKWIQLLPCDALIYLRRSYKFNQAELREFFFLIQELFGAFGQIDASGYNLLAFTQWFKRIMDEIPSFKDIMSIICSFLELPFPEKFRCADFKMPKDIAGVILFNPKADSIDNFGKMVKEYQQRYPREARRFEYILNPFLPSDTSDDDDDDYTEERVDSPAAPKERVDGEQERDDGREVPLSLFDHIEAWSCSECTSSNAMANLECASCGSLQPIILKESVEDPVTSFFAVAGKINADETVNKSDHSKEGDKLWSCHECSLENPRQRTKCLLCETANPTHQQATDHDKIPVPVDYIEDNVTEETADKHMETSGIMVVEAYTRNDDWKRGHSQVKHQSTENIQRLWESIRDQEEITKIEFRAKPEKWRGKAVMTVERKCFKGDYLKDSGMSVVKQEHLNKWVGAIKKVLLDHGEFVRPVEFDHAVSDRAQSFSWNRHQKPQVEEMWTCSICTLDNVVTNAKCACCDYPNPLIETFDAVNDGVINLDQVADVLGEAEMAKNKRNKSDEAVPMWSCSVCTLDNPQSNIKCECCGNPKDDIQLVTHIDPCIPSAPRLQSQAARNSAQQVNPDETDWHCRLCTLKNEKWRIQCQACRAVKLPVYETQTGPRMQVTELEE